MAGVAEKARFYLERAVPQLREWEEKEIFTKDEIRNLVSKRSAYEHRVLAPGTTPQVFIAYAEWEMSLEELRAKRCRRLRIRNSTSYKSQARVVQILERGLVKHPGSLELWRSLLACLDLTGAAKRWHKTMVRALRLHPGDAGLWVVAGRRYAERGDMQKGRGMFLRGCRFCVGRQALVLWTEYARAELEWLARTEKKLETGQHDTVQHSDEYLPVGGGDEDSEDEDFIKFDDDEEFPVPTKEQKDLIDREASKKLAQSPALSGAIPIAVFDIAKKQDFFDAHAAMNFWDIFADATGISCRDILLNHVMGYMTSHFNNHAETKYCHARMCLVGLKTGTPAWVKGINEALHSIAESLQNLMLLGSADELNKFMGLTRSWLGQLMDGVDKNSDIHEVLEGARERLQPTES